MQHFPAKKKKLSGWGGVPAVECVTYRPEKRQMLAAFAAGHEAPVIARGCGRAYGDAALSVTGVVEMERLDRFIAFDEKTGVLRVEAGVTLADMLNVVIPAGWFLPVIPGTKFVSAGGAFASNVHGKNHARQGDFARHVVECVVRLASGEAITCSKTEHSDVFWATAGGMGLTGIIEEMTLQLLPVTSLSLRVHTKKTPSIHAMVTAFRQSDAEYKIGWIDHFVRGDAFGRGVFEMASHISEHEGGMPLASYRPPTRGITIPPFFPGIVLNRYSMALYNVRRFRRYGDSLPEEVVGFEGFFHPLDRLQHWNRLYGRRGFFQYQCVIPDSPDVADHLNALLQLIRRRGCFSYLAVLKYMGDHEGLLSFPLRGFSLALDFPNTPAVCALQHELNEQVANLGGRVYLTKDALLSRGHFERMYRDALPEWKRIVRECDPARHFMSEMAIRLGMKE